MKIYTVIDGDGTPLGVYTDPTEARFCKEKSKYVDGYTCVHEWHDERTEHTCIDYEKKTTCEFGPITFYKTVHIYIMELQQPDKPRCTCGETDNLAKVIATPLPSGTYHLCPRCKREESEA